MHILFDGRMISNTGIGRIVQNFITFLPNINDIFITIIVNDTHNLFQSKYRNLSIRKLKVKIPIYSILEQVMLPLEISNVKPDLIHFPNFNFPIFEKRPFIVTINDLIYYLFLDACGSRFKHLCAKYMITQAIKRARKIITISNYSKYDLLKYFKTSEEKIIVIYPGVDATIYRTIVDEEMLQRCKNRYGITKKFIFYTGNHEPRKNLIRLIRAFSLLKNVDEYQLVIGGRVDLRRSKLYQFAEESNLKNNIIFTNFVSEKDLVLLYNMAELFVFPSLYEGFGLPPLESMSCGTPVVCSNTTALPEVVGDAAILFNPLDILEIKKSMESILLNKGLRNSLIEKAKRRVEKFNWNNMAEKLLQLYKIA